MMKRPLWQTLIVSTLWLASISSIIAAFYLQYVDNQQSLQTVLSDLKPVSTQTQQTGDLPSYVPGLFGVAIKSEIAEKKEPEKKTAVSFGPKSLEGVFIHDQQAYALVTDYNNDYQIIPPSSITAHSLNSVTVQTNQGIKSLHMQQNRSGVDIRRITKRRKDKNGVIKEEISEADKIRIMLLQGG